MLSMSQKFRGVSPAPLLIGPKNAEAVVGVPWRWCRDWARKLGIAFVGTGKKQLIPAGAFIAAIERDGFPTVANDATVSRAEPIPLREPERSILLAIGMRKRDGNDE